MYYVVLSFSGKAELERMLGVKAVTAFLGKIQRRPGLWQKSDSEYKQQKTLGASSWDTTFTEMFKEFPNEMSNLGNLGLSNDAAKCHMLKDMWAIER